MSEKIYGIDMGTNSIKIYQKAAGVILHQKNMIAMVKKKEPLALGDEAYSMYEKAPKNIEVKQPIINGVIADFTAMQTMIQLYFKGMHGKKFAEGLAAGGNAEFYIAVPSDITEVEKKAVEDATYQAGAREVAIIEEPVAAAIGAGIDIGKACGNMIVDIGGGTADIAVISLGGPVVSTSIKIAGDDFDEALVRYMRKKHNLLIGERTAEEIKINIGSAYRRPEVLTMEVRGRNLVTGLPKTIVVTSEETLEALREPAMQIVDAVHNVLERTPPELAADIFDRGIVMTGGGSLLNGLDQLIEEKTGITTMVAEDPLTAVAIGTGKFIEFQHGDKKEQEFN